MLTPGARAAVALLLLAGGSMLLYWHEPAGWALLYATGVVVLNWVRVGTVHLAFAAYRRGDLERVRELLAMISRPALLRRRHQAYYHWLHGVLLVVAGRTTEAYAELRRVPARSIRRESDRGRLLCQLADLALDDDDVLRAQLYLQEAREIRQTAALARMIASLEARTTATNNQRTPTGSRSPSDPGGSITL